MHPTMLSLIPALMGAQHPFALPGIAFASRFILKSSIERTFNLRPHALWLLALHDAISFAVFICSFFTAAIEWRGQNYRILRDGTLEKDNFQGG
jgi:ceramide glucosyltransferase